MNRRTGKREALIAIANQASDNGETVLFVSFGRKKPPALNESVQHQSIKPICVFKVSQ